MSMMPMQNLPLKNQKVLVRVDFNVPLSNDPTHPIADLTRIQAALPTIQYLLKEGCSIILMSHLGSPDNWDPELSLFPCAKALEMLLERPVQMAPNCIGVEVKQAAAALQSGEILLLENLRFHPAEQQPATDPSFAKQLSELASFYINDAFGAAHRAHSSTTTIVPYFSGKAGAGLLMQKEVNALSQLLTCPKRPFFALLGGAKISSKIGAIEALIPKVDALFIGGAMAFTFLKAQGMPVGNSLYEEDQIFTALKIIETCKTKKIPLHLPRDFIAVDVPNENGNCQFVSATKGIPDGWLGVDVGPHTIIAWQRELQAAKTVFWNGPLGQFEVVYFAQGTRRIARTIASLQATTIVGGGDSVAAVVQANLQNDFSHLSTGGGASLKFLEKGTLPAIEALSTQN